MLVLILTDGYFTYILLYTNFITLNKKRQKHSPFSINVDCKQVFTCICFVVRRGSKDIVAKYGEKYPVVLLSSGKLPNMSQRVAAREALRV